MTEPRDPPTHRRRRHLPRPQQPDPPRRRSPGRVARLMGRSRRYLGLDVLAKSRLAIIIGDTDSSEEVTVPAPHRIEPDPRSRGGQLKHHFAGRDQRRGSASARRKPALRAARRRVPDMKVAGLDAHGQRGGRTSRRVSQSARAARADREMAARGANPSKQCTPPGQTCSSAAPPARQIRCA